MCGIVGIGSKQSQMNSVLVKFFETMLYHDIVRGPHATGVYRGMPEDAGVAYYKDAVPSFEYLSSANWDILKGENTTEYQAKQLANKGEDIPLPLSNFYVGHNRYATMGAKTDPKGAHPFNEGDITLVHNGTLTGQWRLPDHTKYKVDSNNIAHSINKIGFEETLSKLQGAYTLIWHDNRDKTLNFFRNEERPLFMVELTSGSWIWCSEEDMFHWLNERRKVEFQVKRAFELPVGHHYVFDVSKDNFEFKEVIERDLPEFQVYRSYGSGYSSGRGPAWANGGYVGGTPKKEENVGSGKANGVSNTQRQVQALSNNLVQRTNNVLSAHEIQDVKHGSAIGFTPYEWRAYYDGSKNGRIRGYYLEGSNYAEVEGHGFSEDDFLKVENVELYGRVKSAYPESNSGDGISVDPDSSTAVVVVDEIAMTEAQLTPVKKDDSSKK